MPPSPTGPSPASFPRHGISGRSPTRWRDGPSASSGELCLGEVNRLLAGAAPAKGVELRAGALMFSDSAALRSTRTVERRILAKALRASPDWVVLYEDRHSVVFTKRGHD